MKYKSKKPLISTREAIPGIKIGKGGLKELTCPFCTPTHVLSPEKPSPCGTIIEVRAVQVVIPSRTAKQKGVICLKCHKSGGEMIQHQNGFIHKEECDPSTVLMIDPPKYSKLADALYKLPERAHVILKKYTGILIKEAQEIDPQGVPTGKILGHFFYKGV